MGGQHVGIASDREFVTLVPEIKMAAIKLEVFITRLICHLRLKYQRLWLYFHRRPTRSNYIQQITPYPDTRNQDDGYKIGSPYNYMPFSHDISIVIPVFRGRPTRWNGILHLIRYPFT